jgi:hypothetical protein
MKGYFETLGTAALGSPYSGAEEANLERAVTDELVGALQPIVTQAQEAVRDRQPYEKRLAPLVAGYEVARRTREILNSLSPLSLEETLRRLDAVGRIVQAFDPGEVFGRGPALYPPIVSRWEAFRNRFVEQAGWIAATFIDPRIILNLDKGWRFQTDPRDAGLREGWMNPNLDATAWSWLNADGWWQEQGFADYHGTAWYRRSVEPSPAARGRRIILFFGAVDGDAVVFVDGRQVGEHLLLADGTGWDRPFYFDLTAHVAAGTSNLVAVRVRKLYCMGGIFRGVKLLDASGVRE